MSDTGGATAADGSSDWQRALLQVQDAAKKEWMALERRYHLRRVSEDAETHEKLVAVFLSLSDPDLPEQFKGGELELQLRLPAKYPDEAPYADFSQWRARLPENQIEALGKAFDGQAASLRGTFSLRKLLTWIDNNIARYVAADEQTTDAQEEQATAETPIDETGTGESKPARRRRSRRPCHFFARGKCTNGDQCQYSHELRKPKVKPSEAEQTQVVSDETTQAEAKEPTNSVAKATPSSGKRPRYCKYFARNSCREGDACKFVHEVKQRKSKAKAFRVGSGATPPESTPEPEVIDLEAVTKVSETLTPTTATTSNDWTEEQQRALDLALKTYPATMDKKVRWSSIAEAVEGRSLNECIDRFKVLSLLVRKEQEKTVKRTKNADYSPSKIPIEKESGVEEQATEDGPVVDLRIIPHAERVAIETEPAVNGTQIRLDDLFLYQIGTVVPHRLKLQLGCTNCPLRFDAVLSLDGAEIHKWCPRCSALHDVRLRPVFAHAQSAVLAYVDSTNCTVVDVLPSEIAATCLDCGNEVLLDNVTPGRRCEKVCFTCHVKVALEMKRYVVGYITSRDAKDLPAKTAAKSTGRRIVETFEVGKPLPRNGVCDHYKHSFRWFRFQCCGKAFPCDVCHDASDCAEANMGKIASRMICGLCSKEQSSSIKVCSCGNEVGQKASGSSHWEGGKGCRNQNMMSQNDKQKYRGQNKTESKKFKRVGAEAKARRTQNSTTQ